MDETEEEAGEGDGTVEGIGETSAPQRMPSYGEVEDEGEVPDGEEDSNRITTDTLNFPTADEEKEFMR